MPPAGAARALPVLLHPAVGRIKTQAGTPKPWTSRSSTTSAYLLLQESSADTRGRNVIQVTLLIGLRVPWLTGCSLSSGSSYLSAIALRIELRFAWA